MAANVGGLSFDALSRAVWPFVGAMVLALVIVTLWPDLSHWVPRALHLG